MSVSGIGASNPSSIFKTMQSDTSASVNEANEAAELAADPNAVALSNQPKDKFEKAGLAQPAATTKTPLSKAADLAIPPTTADAPKTINLSGMQADFDRLWKDSFKNDPNGKPQAQEQGGTIVADRFGNLSLTNMTPGTEGDFSPDYNVGPDKTVMGVFHTHPFVPSENKHQLSSLSGDDAAALIGENLCENLSENLCNSLRSNLSVAVAQSGSEQFMFMRTGETKLPEDVDFAKLKDDYYDKAEKLIYNMTRAHANLPDNVRPQTFDTREAANEASKIAAKEIAKEYGLAYYEGSNGVFQRVSPP
jgi:type VI secretion system secreted protein VgrG